MRGSLVFINSSY